MNEKYKDMLRLPHPVSATHPRMSLQDRAAQFSPFAALTERGTYGKDHLFRTGHSEKRRCLQHSGRMRAKN